ncbi:hypothetical protein [Hydrogenovibrio thermophilus]|uniref:Uncharacterized protein n=1 Tax=Hydrogenovibrio thermophilus TaxID=265883 RepID=A0A451G4P8_9GAMM|nr:hypothetical protein [Hydrogenovibrio thermophilus]QAB14455.1 hypothetical protein EPV75_01620 [Hydrogenovibrio thermophilus]
MSGWNLVKRPGLVVIGLLVLLLSACSKPPVELTTVKIVDNLDRGSGNFDRMLQICFTEPLRADYYHHAVLISNQGFKIEGGSMLRPLASDPDNKCQLRNLYNYVGKDSPPGVREMIKEFMVPGNVNQVLIQIYDEQPTGNELPIEEKLFRNI